MTSSTVVVVDTSVVIKWYIPEPGTSEAVALRHATQHLLAPDLVVSEFGNVLWKKVQRAELEDSEAREIARAFAIACPLTLRSSLAYLPAALELALTFKRTVYDALFIATAVAEGGMYVTADERLVNALASSPVAGFVRLLLP